MRRQLRNFALTFAAALALLVSGTSPAQACTTPGNVNGLASALAQGVNQVRATNGVSAIGTDPRLMAAAQTQACHLARIGRIEHRGPRGGMVMNRVRGAGYQGCLAAENLAWGHSDPGQILNSWMQSPAHRSNLLHTGVGQFGIGIAQGAQGPVWVLVLARGC